MKKKYEKPGLYIENFALSQSIAMDCNLDKKNSGTVGFPTHGDIDTCGWSDSVDVVWLNTTNCTQIADNDFIVDAGCYNNPAGLTSLFAFS